MRPIMIGLLLLAGAAAAGVLTDVLDHPPASWRELETEAMNATIAAAGESGEEWVRSPLAVVLHLLHGDEGTHRLLVMEEKGRGENPDAATIVCIRDGYLDDSVRGEWHELTLRRREGGTWRIAAAKVAYRCWRTGGPDAYQSDPCP